jgi:2-dehydro-3-deoxyphosphogluconate aldolase / (4S)-4-hydroxy-2-oxoglutarate aldolase
MDASKLLAGSRIVPVVVLHNAEVAVPLARALLEAGLGVIEVTLRTADALQGMEQIAKSVPEMIVGAGSVRRPEHFVECVNAGARFAVCPGYSERLLDAAATHKMPFIPGAATASEMIALYEHGYTLQKFFPAELAGGRAYLKAVGAPLPEVRFMPTGGVSPDNVLDYLALGNVACVGGSWITPPDLQSKGDFAGIQAIARGAADLLL